MVTIEDHSFCTPRTHGGGGRGQRGGRCLYLGASGHVCFEPLEAKIAADNVGDAAN